MKIKSEGVGLVIALAVMCDGLGAAPKAPAKAASAPKAAASQPTRNGHPCSPESTKYPC
jgi:hypothetical protein